RSGFVGTVQPHLRGFLPCRLEGAARPAVLAALQIHLVIAAMLQLWPPADVEAQRPVSVRVPVADLDVGRNGRSGYRVHRHRVLRSEPIVLEAGGVAADEGDERNGSCQSERGADAPARQ